MFGCALSLSRATRRRRRRRGSLATALRWLLLRGWLGAENKMTNRHRPSHRHFFTLIRFGIKVNRFGSCFLDFLNNRFGFNKILGFNKGLGLDRGFRLHGHVCLISAALRHALSQLVPHGCKFVQTSVPQTKVVSFAYCEPRRKKIFMSYVNV